MAVYFKWNEIRDILQVIKNFYLNRKNLRVIFFIIFLEKHILVARGKNSSEKFRGIFFCWWVLWNGSQKACWANKSWKNLENLLIFGFFIISMITVISNEFILNGFTAKITRFLGIKSNEMIIESFTFLVQQTNNETSTFSIMEISSKVKFSMIKLVILQSF